MYQRARYFVDIEQLTLLAGMDFITADCNYFLTLALGIDKK